MGRSLEFALTTAIVYIVHIILAFFVATLIGRKISTLFNTLIEAFPF